VIAVEAGSGVGTGVIPIEMIWGREIGEPGLECNSGAPMSRRRSFRLQTSVLGADSGPISCPKFRTVALSFGWADPVLYIRRLLAELGYASPEAAQEVLLPAARPCVCTASAELYRTRVRDTRPETVLEKALILGLSTTFVFDPERPVIWTRTSLTRRLAYYNFGGFYDD
jgi:hypothetical protein